MIKVIEINGRAIPGDVYGVAYKFGERLNRSACYMEYGGATITARKTGDNVVVIVAVTAGAFASVPRIFGVNDGYGDDLVAAGEGEIAYPLSADGSTTQTLSFPEDEPPEVSRDGLMYGNIDWTGINTADEGEPSDAPVLTWKGPTGRTIPFDVNKEIPGLTVSDIVFDIRASSKFTCFGSYIYEQGDVAYMAPTNGVIDTPTKVLGAAYQGNTLVCIVNNHYEEVVGFFEEVWANDSEDGGWRKLNTTEINTGRPTAIWAFNRSGTRATQGVAEYVIDLAAGTAVLKAGDAGGIKLTLQKDSESGNHSTSYSGSETIWSDYKGDERVFAVVTAAGGQRFEYASTSDSTETDAPVYLEGNMPVTNVGITGNQVVSPGDSYSFTGQDDACCEKSAGDVIWGFSNGVWNVAGANATFVSGCGVITITAERCAGATKAVKSQTGFWCTTAVSSHVTDGGTYLADCCPGGYVTIYEADGVRYTVNPPEDATRIVETAWGRHAVWSTGTQASGAKTAPPTACPGTYPSIPTCTEAFAEGLCAVLHETEEWWAVQTSTRVWQCTAC